MSLAAELDGLRPAVDAEARAAPNWHPTEPMVVAVPSRPTILGDVAEALEQRRLFLLLPFALIVGLIANTQVPLLPSLTVLGAGGVALAGVAVMLRASSAGLRATALLAAFWLGFSLLAIHGALFGTTMLGRAVYGAYTAHIDEVLSDEDGETRVVVSAITATDERQSPPIRRARLLIKGQEGLRGGDTLTGKMRFYQVPGPAVPGGFDAQFHSYFAGIGAYGTLLGPPQVTHSDGPGNFGQLIASIRTGIADRIDRVVPQPAAGIARAIINGDQSAVDETARDTMALAGIAHVLSVSGLHLTLVAGGVYGMIRLMLAALNRVLPRLPAKPWAAGAGIAAAVFYCSISGGDVAALRSTIMIILVLGAVIFGRQALTMRNVAVAAITVILLDPASVFRASFQLSFAAVVALVGAFELYRPERTAPSRWFWRLLRYFGGMAGTSLVAGAATLLFSAYHFQQTSPLSVLGNLATLPLVGFLVMPLAVISVLMMPLGFQEWPLRGLGWSVDRMLDLAKLVADLSQGLEVNPLLAPISLLIGLVALGWFAFLQTRWRLLAPLLAIPFVLLLGRATPPDVLISDTTQAVAVRSEAGLMLATGKPESFTVTVWRDTFGEPLEVAAPGTVHCDALACIAQAAPGFTVSIVSDPAGFAEDCGAVELVISRSRAPHFCSAQTQVIDQTNLSRGGVTQLIWDAQRRSFTVRPAIPDPGRPWRAVLP